MGVTCRQKARNAVGLAHRRLSIIDLSETGWQPMSSPDGRYHIVYNGEIYNYIELREELLKRGHRFRGESDTEVLLAACAEWGTSAFPRLVGMFAFALLDTAEHRLLLARDFMGIKPLYYATWPGGLAFASEIKALLKVPAVSSKGNPQALFDYLCYGLYRSRRRNHVRGYPAFPRSALCLDLSPPAGSVVESRAVLDAGRGRFGRAPPLARQRGGGTPRYLSRQCPAADAERRSRGLDAVGRHRFVVGRRRRPRRRRSRVRPANARLCSRRPPHQRGTLD